MYRKDNTTANITKALKIFTKIISPLFFFVKFDNYYKLASIIFTACFSIFRRYKAGQVIFVQVEILADRKGYFEFSLCPRDSINEKITQKCFKR